MKIATSWLKFYLSIFLIIPLTLIGEQVAALPLNNELTVTEVIQRANQFYRQGKYQDTIQILEKLITSVPASLEQGIAYNNLAAAYYQIGQSNQAIANWEEAISLFENIDNDEAQKWLMLAIISSSQTYINIGLTSKAIPRLERVVNLINEEVELGKLSAQAQASLGNAYSMYKDYERAIVKYEESLKLNRNPLVLINLSQALIRRAAQLESEALLVKDNPQDPLFRDLKAQALKERARAIETANSALLLSFKPGIRAKISSRVNILVFFKNHLSPRKFQQYTVEVIELLAQLPDSSFKAFKLIELARVLDKQDSLPILSKSASVANNIGDSRTLSVALGEIAKIHEIQREYTLARDFISKGLLAAENALADDNLFRLFWQLARLQTRMGFTDKAIKSYESGLDNLRSRRGFLIAAQNNLLFSLRDEVKPFFREYLDLLLPIAQSEPQRLQKTVEILSLLKLSELQSYFNDVCLEIIVQSLAINKASRLVKSKNKAIVYSLITPDKTYLILGLASEKFKIYSLDISADKLKELIQRHRSQLKDAYSEEYITTSQKLYNLFIRPLEADLLAYSIKHLVFINDSILRNIPLEVWHNGEQYLIEKYAISYQSGLKFKLATQFDERENTLIAGLTSSLIPSEQLIYTDEEVKNVRDLLEEAEILFNGNFTQQNLVKQLSNRRYSIVHLATHGAFRGTAKNSFILTYDRKINLDKFKEILLTTQIPVSLLSLSACETAAGNEFATLGFAGLGVRTGVKNVFATLWSINDGEALPVVREFYRQLAKERVGLAEAKRQAQIQQIRQKTHPVHWGAFVLVSP